MTQTPDDTEAIVALRARNLLVRTVRTRLKGSGLDIRELTHHLVISQPGHPDQGRIYITYANGDASLRRCTWAYLGHLDTHHSADPEAEPPLSTQKIIAILSGQTSTPS